MAVNKVVYAGTTLVDLTSDTVTPETLAEGVTAHDASGSIITGTMTAGDTTAYTVYIGTTEPTTDIGNDGDIYIVRTVSA